MKELKKFKMLPSLGSESRHLWHLWLSSPACYLSPKSPICWKPQSFRSLCSHPLLIFGLRILFGISRAWLHKDLKGWGFQQIGDLGEGYHAGFFSYTYVWAWHPNTLQFNTLVVHHPGQNCKLTLFVPPQSMYFSFHQLNMRDFVSKH